MRRLSKTPKLVRPHDSVVTAESTTQHTHALAEATQPQLKPASPAVRAITKCSLRQVTERVANAELSGFPQGRLLCLEFVNLLKSGPGYVVVTNTSYISGSQLITAPKPLHR